MGRRPLDLGLPEYPRLYEFENNHNYPVYYVLREKDGVCEAHVRTANPTLVTTYEPGYLTHEMFMNTGGWVVTHYEG